MALQALATQIKGAIDFFTDKDNSNPYPRDPDILRNINLINEFEETHWRKSFKYSFLVTDKKTKKNHPKFKVYDLQLNPEDIQQDEIFANNITPTQNGVVTEHNSIVLRDLSISGTTGVHPFRGAGGANNKGKVILASPQLKSGYKEFNQLRNYFRAYAEMKKKGDENKDYVMIFINRRDKETLVVEPLKFTMKRSANRATLYSYQIQMKIVGNLQIEEKNEVSIFEQIDNFVEKATDLIATGRGILLQGQAIIAGAERAVNNTLFGPLRQLDFALKAAQGIPLAIGNVSDNLVGRFSSLAVFKILGLVKDQQNNISVGSFGSLTPSQAEAVGRINTPENIEKASLKGGDSLLALGPDALNNIVLDENDLSEDAKLDFEQEREDALSFTRSNLIELKENTENLENTLNNVFGAGDEEFTKFIGAPSDSFAEEGKQTTLEEAELLYGLSLIKEGLDMLIATGNQLFEEDALTKEEFINENFDNQLTFLRGQSVIEISLPQNTTLEQLAIQFLGDPNRWIDIVLVNNLKPPYIDEDSTTKKVKKPGDRILIPSTEASLQLLSPVVGENRLNSRFTETEKQMGIDFQLNAANDIVVGSNNDIVLITGGDNLKQGIKTKFSLDKGDLLYHGNIGIGLVVGEKLLAANEVVDLIKETVLQDDRVGDIKDFSVTVEGGLIIINLTLLAKESQAPIPISIDI